MTARSTSGTFGHGAGHTRGWGGYFHGGHGGDTSQVRCFCCHKLGHYASNCPAALASVPAQLAEGQEDMQSQEYNDTEDTTGVQLIHVSNNTENSPDTPNISYFSSR